MPGIQSLKASVAPCLLALSLVGPLFAQPPACPNAPVPGISSWQTPADVCVPAGFPGNPIAFFDDYSWKTFIALVWPAKTGQRGVPDTTQSINSTGASGSLLRSRQ